MEMRMEAGFKAFRNGTHRTVSPVDTLARVKPLMGTMGITRVANVTGLDRIGIPVVMVCRPNSRSVAVSQGKGLDLDAAKASGLMESVETWHAERITLPLKLGSFNDLGSTHPLVDVGVLPLVNGSRYRADLPMLWIESRNLCTDEPTWLPYELVHSNYTLPFPPGHGCFPASTNGLASGNHLLEATCHAICEVIERDSTSIWHQLDKARRAATRLDLRTVDDDACCESLEKLRFAGLSIAAWDTTTDVGAPSFYCFITENDSDDGHLGAGAGCHPTKQIALLRALTEAVQTRTTYIAGSRDDLTPEEFTRSGIFEKHRAARALIARDTTPRDFQKILSQEAETFETDLQWLLERLESAGITSVCTVDLTKPELELPVVRAVIPGLEAPHDEEDYVPGPRALAARERHL